MIEIALMSESRDQNVLLNRIRRRKRIRKEGCDPRRKAEEGMGSEKGQSKGRAGTESEKVNMQSSETVFVPQEGSNSPVMEREMNRLLHCLGELS